MSKLRIKVKQVSLYVKYYFQMEYKEILARSIQHINYRELFTKAVENPDHFNIIFDLMFDPDEKTSWHAAWICEKVCEKYPDYFTGNSLQRIIKLAVSTSFPSLQRITLSIILDLGLPRDVPVEFINACFDRMISPKSPTGVQVLSMKILYEFTRHQPDFIPEYKAYLEAVEIDSYTAGFRTARKNILKKMR